MEVDNRKDSLQIRKNSLFAAPNKGFRESNKKWISEQFTITVPGASPWLRLTAPDCIEVTVQLTRLEAATSAGFSFPKWKA